MKYIKNKIVLFVVFFVIIFIIFRNLHKETNQNSFSENENQLSSTQSQDPKTIKSTTKESNSNPNSIEKYEVQDDQFEVYDKMESSWLSNIKTIIDKEYFEQYLSLRENCDKEKLEAYKMYHDYLRKKYGENFKYNLSEDQSILEKKINEKYLLKLSKLIGEDNFKNYLKVRDTFNENIRRNAGENKFIIVEF